jgi:hypothetical protein
LLFLNQVIIIKTKVLLPHVEMIIAEFGCPVTGFGFVAPEDFILLGFQIFWL